MFHFGCLGISFNSGNHRVLVFLQVYMNATYICIKKAHLPANSANGWQQLGLLHSKTRPSELSSSVDGPWTHPPLSSSLTLSFKQGGQKTRWPLAESNTEEPHSTVLRLQGVVCSLYLHPLCYLRNVGKSDYFYPQRDRICRVRISSSNKAITHTRCPDVGGKSLPQYITNTSLLHLQVEITLMA